MTRFPAWPFRVRETLAIKNDTVWWTSMSRVASGCLFASASLLAACQTLSSDATPLIEGVVWQLDNASIDARGNWHEIGAKRLLIQWISVDGISFLADPGQTTALHLPDWQRIGKEPWAQEVILGLAGRFDETAARADVSGLIAESIRLAKLPIPLNVVGWYFPVEVDSTWDGAKSLPPLLAQLPRPLWISVYDRANIGAKPFARWLNTWLPADVRVLFQDGVGVHARTAPVARQYADELLLQFGQKRVGIIAEAFRPQIENGFRSATSPEIREQLKAYRGLTVYLFDGPHYVTQTLVNEVLVDKN
ncbi:MAG: hypothetical protein ABIO88_08440 [Burkholderiaceae bacterium]